MGNKVNLADNEHYKVLGFKGTFHIAIHIEKVGKPISFHPRDLGSPMTLLMLAPLDFWQGVASIRVDNPGDRLVPASTIIDAAKSIGKCPPEFDE